MTNLRRVVNAPYWQKGFWFWFLSPLWFATSFVWAAVAHRRRQRGYAVAAVGRQPEFVSPRVSTGSCSEVGFPRVGFPRVLCCGNVIVGGTGKSPVVRRMAQEFLEAGSLVAVVARGIGAKNEAGVACSPTLVATAEKCMLNVLSPAQLSDENREHFEILKLSCPGASFAVFQGANRTAALASFAALAAARGVASQNAVAILDDGLQHFAAPRDANLCVWNPAIVASAPAMCLPVGPYREGMGASGLARLLGAFDARVWSRCGGIGELPEFVIGIESALARFGLKTGNRDFAVLGEQQFFVADFSANGAGIVHSNANAPLFDGVPSALCVSGLANGKQFVTELVARFAGVGFEHVELADHAALSRRALARMAQASCIVLSGKDFFRWCDNPRFRDAVAGKKVVVCVMDVRICALDGTVVSAARIGWPSGVARAAVEN